MPTPMMPPTPIAVSCHRPEALVELAYAASASISSILVDREAPQDRTGLVCTHVCPSVLTPERTAELTARTRARSFDTWRIESKRFVSQ